jgi:signal transduction histidine kinase
MFKCETTSGMVGLGAAELLGVQDVAELTTQNEAGTASARLLQRQDGSSFRAVIDCAKGWYAGVPAMLVTVRDASRAVQLESEVVAARELIARLRDELQRRQEQVNEIVSSVVHDLKTQLNIITTDLYLAKQDPDLSDETRESLHAITVAADSMSRIAMNLADIRRATDGGLVLGLQRVDVRLLLDMVRGNVVHAATLKNQDIQTKIELSDPLIDADPELLRRAIVNLVDHTIKCAEEGAVIRVEVRDMGDDVEIRVGDGAPGASEPPVPTNSALTQANHTRFSNWPSEQRSARLTFCRLVAEAHGGTLDTKPVGSAFRLQIAKRRGEPSEEQA